MKLENQVTNLELSQKLKELGVKQESVWTWVVDTQTKKYKLVIIGSKGFTDYICAGRDNKEAEEMFSAFTVAELGEELPDFVYTIRNEAKKWMPMYNGYDSKLDEIPVEVNGADTEANARAKMLIYLKENKLI